MPAKIAYSHNDSNHCDTIIHWCITKLQSKNSKELGRFLHDSETQAIKSQQCDTSKSVGQVKLNLS